jgi:hypothetical protein
MSTRMSQTTIFDDTVASRIDQLLQRCDRIRRGSVIDRPVVFDAAGQRHAASIAAADQANGKRGKLGKLAKVLPSER